MEQKVKPCPFCNGENIDYSVKTTGRWERKYHVAMYCKDCNCYGKRVLITPTETNRIEIGKNPKYKQLAIDAWNTRRPFERVMERLKERKDHIMKEFILANKAQEVKSESLNRINELDGAIEIIKEEYGISG